MWERISAVHPVRESGWLCCTKSDARFIRFNLAVGSFSLHTQISWLSSICRVTLPIPLRLFLSLAGSDRTFHFLSSSRLPSAQHVDVGICVDLQCVCVYGLVTLQIVRLLTNRRGQCSCYDNHACHHNITGRRVMSSVRISCDLM